MKCNVSAQSHVGLRRPNNEDMILIGNRFLRDETYEIKLQIDEHSGNMLFALADGMGGHKGGEVASEEVLKHLSVFFDSLPSGLSPEELRQTLSTWGREVHAHLKEMGTAPSCSKWEPLWSDSLFMSERLFGSVVVIVVCI